MSKSKEKLQQFSPPPTTTATATTTSSSTSSELKNPITTHQTEDNKKSKDDELSKLKRNAVDDHNHGNSDDHHPRVLNVVKNEQGDCGNNIPKTIENNRNRKKLKDLNDVITCFLCDGYYIEATTINECLHSFCRSCIVQYLQRSKYCPKCKSFNKSINITNLRPDTALRSLVYKLVPGLCQTEIQRLVRFNSNNSTSSSSLSTSITTSLSLASPTSPISIGGNDLNNDLWNFYSPDEMISLSLEYHIHSVIGEQDDSISQIRYLKCPAAVTVHHLQRFISSKFNLKPASKFSIEIIYDDEILPEDFSLMDVAYCYKWERLSPMQFFYRIFVKPDRTITKPVAKCKKVQSVSDQSSPDDGTAVTSQHITTQTTTVTTIVSTNNNNFSNNDNNKNIRNNDNNNVNNGDKNNNNSSSNDDSSSNIKSETKLKDIKTVVQDEIKVVKIECNNNNNNSNINNNNNEDNSGNNSNKIPNINKTSVSVTPPQPPSDFKILRSNDIRYAVTPSSVERPIDISPKKTNSEKRAKLSIKIERTQSHDDYNNNNNNGSKQTGDVVALSPSKRRASASNSITLKRKYNKTDDEDESAGTKKSRSHHHHHHHQKYEIVQSPKIFDDDVDVAESNVPKIKLDLPNLKAKIKVPKPEMTSSKSSDLKSPSITSSSSNSSSPRCSNDDVFIENQTKYAKTNELTPNFTDQNPSSHHHKHHHGDSSSSSHKKRKKSKHSKDSPTEEVSSNSSGNNNGYSSNGNSKKRKIHAEISPQTEKSQDDLKLKFKINYKPAEKPKPPVVPTMVVDDHSSDKAAKTPTSPRIIMILPVPPTTRITSPPTTCSTPTQAKCTPPVSTTTSLMLPKPSIRPSMPTLICTSMTIPTPTISNSISQDLEDVIKRNKIKKTNINMPHRMSPNTEEILNEMRAIHSATQNVPKPMVNIPHLSQVHLQNNDPIYGTSKSPDMKNSNPMLVSIRNTNPITVTSPSNIRYQVASNPRPQMNITLMPGRPQKQVVMKPQPFNFNATTFTNNTYNHPRTPFPILKSINLQRKSCYDIDPIDKKSPKKTTTSIFDFPSEPSSNIYTKKEKNQKRLTPPTLFDEPISSIINSISKLEQSPVKSEPPFYPLMGSSFISENQNSRTPIQPIQLPPTSVSVTHVTTNKVASNQVQNQLQLKNNSGEHHKPVVEILRIQSTTPAVDQQIQPQKVKPNRPPPPLIKRPQMNVGISNIGNQQRRPSGSSTCEVKTVESGTTISSPKVERKSSSDSKESPMCDNIGALDLSGKSSRSPSLEKSPISKSSSRSNSTEDESCLNTSTSSVTAVTTTPPKISLSKQKKITDMFPSSSWSVKVENNGSMNITSSERSTNAGKSEITITTTTSTPISAMNVASSKPPPPKLTEISKLRTYSNSTKTIPATTTTSAATITSVRQQNLSIRNVPNPSALAFRNQMSPNPISSNSSNNSSSVTNNNVANGNNANNNNKAKVSEGKEIEKVIAHLKANAAADTSSKPVAN